MHEILRSSVQVDVLLNRRCLGSIWLLSTKVVLKSKGSSHSIVDEFHDDWEPHIENHCAYNSISHAGKPVLIKVWIGCIEVPGNKVPLLLQVGVAEHEQETCVEENADEYTICDVLHLLGLSLTSNLVNDDDNDHSNDSIDNNDKILDQVVH